MRPFPLLFAAAVLFGVADFASAQAWNIDARSIGLGGAGGSQNPLATTMAEQRGDRTIVLPLGLFQVLRDRDIFDPGSPEFDPLRAVEIAANPMHFEFGRSGPSARSSFVRDLRNGAIQPDLNVYRGFMPQSMSTAGVVSPKWGYTFKLPGSDAGQSHGIYVGTGPQLAFQTAVSVDPGLTDFFSAGTDRYTPGARFQIGNRSTGQAALAMTGGYRGRFPVGASGGTAFVVTNVNYLRGLHYEDVDLALRIATDTRGLVAGNAPAGAPLAFTRRSASSGSGASVDIGGGFAFGPWEVGFNGNNLANRLQWRNVVERDYALSSLTSGTRFTTSPRRAVADVESTVPADYRSNLGFHSQHFSFQGEVGRQSDRVVAHGGIEQRFARVELRGGGTYTDGQWLPSVGLSVPLHRRLQADLAAFSSIANVERERRFSLAASLRLVSGR